MAKKLKFLRKVPKVALVGIVMFGIISGWFFVSRARQEPIELISVKRQDIKTVVSASGILAGKETVNLKFKSSGKLAYLKVKTGDTVRKGQAIAGLDTQDLAITLQQALNTLRDKQATAEKILDDVKNHETDETFAQRATRTTAEVARDNAYDAVRTSQRTFQDAVILSPINGIVTQQADLSPGQIVSSSDLVAQITNFAEILFSADVDEADITKVKLGQKAEVTLNAYGNKVFTSRVKEILPQVKTTANGATTVVVKINLVNSEIRPIYGLNGQASIIISESPNALVIPQEALVGDNEVFVKIDKRVIKKQVSLGIRSDTGVEVISGLAENEEVVKNPEQSPNQRSNQNIFRGVFRLFGPSRR